MFKIQESLSLPFKRSGCSSRLMEMCPSHNQNPLVLIGAQKQSCISQQLLSSTGDPGSPDQPWYHRQPCFDTCFTQGVPLTASSSHLHPSPSLPGLICSLRSPRASRADTCGTLLAPAGTAASAVGHHWGLGGPTALGTHLTSGDGSCLLCLWQQAAYRDGTRWI